jgi:2-aminoadipate transaminase
MYISLVRYQASRIDFLSSDINLLPRSQQLKSREVEVAPPIHSARDPEGADWARLFASRASAGGGELTAILALAGATDTITFSGGFPAKETFPVGEIREVVEELLRSDAARALQYSPTEGLPESRAAAADFVATQGVRPDPDGVLITSGSIEALQLLSRVLLDPGDAVLVEAPSYLGAVMAFAGAGAAVTGIRMDDDGLAVDELEAVLASGLRPKLLYVIPDYQNPTGLSLTTERRRALVSICRRYGLLCVEDVAYRELGFDGGTTESLWSLGPDVVVQIGTFSKTLFPGIRLGWAIGPGQVVSAMTVAKQNSDQCAGALGQRIMERFVAEGRFPAHLAAARALYARRAELMLSAIERHMPEGVQWTKPRGGFFVWLTANDGIDTARLAPVALARKVAYVPGAPFYADARGRNQLRLAYSGVPDENIEEGVARLAALLANGVKETG